LGAQASRSGTLTSGKALQWVTKPPDASVATRGDYVITIFILLGAVATQQPANVCGLLVGLQGGGRHLRQAGEVASAVALCCLVRRVVQLPCAPGRP